MFSWSHNLLFSRMSILLVAMALVPAAIVGLVSYSALQSYIQEDRVSEVGHAAAAKHDDLVFLLKRQKMRAEALLGEVNAFCGNPAASAQAECRKRLSAYMKTEAASGLALYRGDEMIAELGAHAPNPNEVVLRPEQLAKFEGSGAGNNAYYYITSEFVPAGLRLAIAYPSSSLQMVFATPPELGETGETFLTDGEGYFVTRPSFTSTQGHSHPISARPMLTCLSGKSGTTLDLDYREADVIHGFEFVPEFGSACVMAHIMQSEAFAPLVALKRKFALFLFLLLASAIPLALFISGKIKKANEALQKIYLLMQNSMDGIRILNINGDILDVNDAFGRMLGYSRAELLNANVADFDAQFSREELARRFKALAGKKASFETLHRHRDGSLLNVEISVSSTMIGGQMLFFATSRDISERKKAERVLRTHSQVLDTAMDGYWLIDEKGMLVEANEAYAKMSGYGVEELKGMRVNDLEAKESEQDTRAHIARVIAEGSDRFETRHRRKDGTVFDVEVSVSHLPATRQFAVFSRDITEKKLAEAVVSASEANLQAMLDNSPYLTWLKDAEGRYIKVNKVFADFLRLENPAQAEGKTDLDLQPRELAEKYRKDDAEVMAQRCRKHVEESAFDGKHTFWVEAWKTPIISEAGEVLGTVGFAGDITARKEAEEALRIAAATFETHDAILITDAKANIIRVNRAFTDITGYTEDEVRGWNPRIMSSGRQDKAFYVEMWQQLLHTGSWAGEIWDKRKNGQVYPKWLTITAVKDPQGETTHYVAIFSDITARKQAEEEIRNLAFYDALTKLPNRRLFLDRFRAAQTISARHNDFGAVFFIDLDRFKTLNDTMGHEYGDLMLIEVANRIKACVREMDTVGRLGGDEFMVLIEGAGEDELGASRHVGAIAEKIRESLALPYHLKNYLHYSSPSIGISLFRGTSKPVEELVQQADMAMYQAKSTGRNAVRFFDPVMQHKVAERSTLENDLHHAVARHELQLHYQVQVDCEHRPTGAEALIRWMHPSRGMIMPDDFIPIAEESMLIVEVGNWVVMEACRKLAEWSRNPRLKNLVLAINVSARQFTQPDFVDRIAEAIRIHAINPARLKLELTESLVLHDLSLTISRMYALKTLGVALSLDDFGTGYSSLSYLKDLPLDQIKIDRSFISSIRQGGNDAHLVRTIMDLANNFKLDVIAEGVEEMNQLAFLKNYACPGYQGYLFGKPVKEEAFEAALERTTVVSPGTQDAAPPEK
jgi:diguanylate cyclase (GGDEF)-like protein/PAS domain S-box-containing protein